ncbi:MAG TPA: isoprenylcysteine carboxylmethyltransferase family protein [Segeticoccus sp.]|uniref:methyltransferase family protein n=1 Tax=Segeticoccus sp. TaxID=2706531 RepID=UPI002D805AB9|nr:isoprenylcysteine carboxylmethyltransferase family protein [Segeticoccus sp.]HET8599236.1 isoprenylcysteine carboxylmethyltransferase family protein [Segeticoccus sp.]
MSPHASTTGADVHVPPPVLYAVPFAALSLLGRALPLRLPGGRATRSGGFALVAAGLALGVTGARTILGHDSSIHPDGEVSTIVRDGPYRFSRNPIYLGLTLVYTGGALAQRSALPLFGLPGVLVAMQNLVIQREEHYLRERFGSAYTSYCAQVRRWL